LKGDFFRFAKIRPGEFDEPPEPKKAVSLKFDPDPPRTIRTFEGNEPAVGVAGRTLTLLRGERGVFTDEVIDADEVEEARECL
jgi:hypothetical protein